MRTKSVGKKKINVITLGCSKNVYDSEVLMGQLKANGKEVVHVRRATLSTLERPAARSDDFGRGGTSEGQQPNQGGVLGIHLERLGQRSCVSSGDVQLAASN